MKAEETKYAIEIPYLGSLILTHTLHGKIPGLKEFAPQDRPDSTIIFFTFRIMVGLGLAMLLLGLWGAYLRWRGKLFETRLFMLFALCMGPAGLIAVLAGWITTEVGRQPGWFTVYCARRMPSPTTRFSPSASRSSCSSSCISCSSAPGSASCSRWLPMVRTRAGTAFTRTMAARYSVLQGLFPPLPTHSIRRLRAKPRRFEMGIDLPLVWAVIIAFGVMMYVVMDGFDLGIGILFPFVSDRHERDVMVNTVAPVWDGNETWLVLGGAAMFAAFPLAYGFLLSALYLPLMFMLAGLIWRGVSFEFRFKATDRHKPFWDKAFAGGSYVATFCQGVALGAFIDGFKLEGTTFTGTRSTASPRSASLPALPCWSPMRFSARHGSS